MDWHSYHRLADITGYMHYLEHTYPDLCKVIEIGKSVEGRRTYILRIGSQKYSDKPAIVMEAGMIYFLKNILIFFIAGHFQNSKINEHLQKYKIFFFCLSSEP